MPGRYGRRPSRSSSAADPSTRPRSGARPPPPSGPEPAPPPPLPAGASTGSTRGRTSSSVGSPRSDSFRTARRSGSWIDTTPGSEHAPAATREAHVDAHPAGAAGAERHGLVQQRIAQLASRRRHQARQQLEPERIGVLLLDGVRPWDPPDARARAPRAPPTARRPAPASPSATPGTSRDGVSKRSGRQRQRPGQDGCAGRPRHLGVAAAGVTGPGTRSSASRTTAGLSSPAASGASNSRWGKHRGRQRLDVVGEGVVAPRKRRQRLRGAEEHEPGARARPELHARVGPGRVEHRHDVAPQCVAAVHLRDGGLRGQHLAHAGHRLKVEDAVVV